MVYFRRFMVGLCKRRKEGIVPKSSCRIEYIYYFKLRTRIYFIVWNVHFLYLREFVYTQQMFLTGVSLYFFVYGYLS